MSVLINKDTGLAEDVEDYKSALGMGSHAVPLNDPEGNPVTVSHEEAPDLLAQGYTQPTPENLSTMMDYAKKSSPLEQAKTFAESAASAATFGISKGIEVGSGLVAPTDITGREEVNPGVATLGEMAGLLAPIPGTSAAKVMTGAGELAAKGLGKLAGEIGLHAAPEVLHKVGSLAVKGATENAIFESGKELGKVFTSDPSNPYEFSLPNVGLSAALGAGVMAPFGVAPSVWKLGSESSLGKFLGKVKDRANGVDIANVPSSVEDALGVMGLDAAPEVRAVLGGEPALKQSFQELQHSATKSGDAAREALGNFKNKTTDTVLKNMVEIPLAVREAAAMNPEKDIIGDYARSHIDSLKDLSERKIGDKVSETLTKELDAKYQPLKKGFDEKKVKFSTAELGNEVKANFSNDLMERMSELGADLAPNSPQSKLVNSVVEGLSNPKIKTLEDLNRYRSIMLEQAKDPTMWKTGSAIRKAFDAAEEVVFERELSAKAPELLENFRQTKKDYGAFRGLTEDLNNRLRTGKVYGAETFMKEIREMKPEELLSRLARENDSGIIELLKSQFPETSALIKDYHLSDLLKNAAQKAGENQSINSNTIFKAMDKWSPELKAYVIPEQAMPVIEAARKLMDSLPKSMNTSGTARTLDALSKHAGIGVGAMIASITGSGLGGALIGSAARLVSRDAPDAIKLSMLKFLGSNKPINASGFKAMVDYADSVAKGIKATDNAVKSVFKAGLKTIPDYLSPNEKTRKNLDKKITALQSDPSPLLDVAKDKGYYLEDHAYAAGETTSRAVQYLNSKRPNDSMEAPLDHKFTVSQPEKTAYNRTLDIAEQPLITLESVKNGTLKPSDVQDFVGMYPALYRNISQKLTDEIINQKANGITIPYSTRLCLSLFLGQPLDTTMKPQSILSAQPNQEQVAQQMADTNSHRGNNNALAKLPGQYQTPGQAREAQKLTS